MARLLVPAHRGYEYQDILVACRFVDVLLGTIVEARCDEKLFDDDRFDDLTTIDVASRRERSQFKHTDNDDRPLTLESFTRDSRGLRLDRLLASILADRAGPGSGAPDAVYRVVLRDEAPTDPSLAAVLKPAVVDPGPFIPNMRTQRLGFDAAALWQQREDAANNQRSFTFLFTADRSPTYDELEWACEHLVVEVGAPRASFDLSEPDIAEQFLLARVRSDVGAEAFPNTDRSAIDVAAALVSAARAARQRLLDPTPDELLRRAQLRSDFGAVARSHPVDRGVEVSRPSTVDQLVEVARESAIAGGYLLVVGPPGHGKSWACQQVLDVLVERGWLVAEHYCYLGDADGERIDRVLAEAVFGSLIGRLAEEDPRLVRDQRPRFAADEDALVACLHRSLDLEPDRRIALVVDGIDHITRIRAGRGSSSDPSKSMSEALASLDLPPGAVLIVLSQPGSHLTPLEEAGAETVTLPGLTEREIHLLADRLGLVPTDAAGAGPLPILDDPERIASFLAALTERSVGNALYATYLCREALRSIEFHADPAAVVLHLPPFDGTLKGYYDHLYESLGIEAGWVADVIALVDFAVTRAELREIRPDAAHRVDRALEVLGPVLIERATQGGVRVYHESFARYLRAPFQDDASALASLLDRITGWLDGKGLFVDARAFRSLLPLLAEAGDDDRVVGLVDGRFVTKAVAAGFAVSTINSNLATAVGAAARLHDWPTIVRYVEMSRAAESYQEERFDSTLVAFADVPAALLGADTVATRLLDQDHRVMPARAGLQMCAAVDSLGATAPWRAYMDGYLREADSDNTSYGEASDRAVAVAWMRGRLRLASASPSQNSGAQSTSSTRPCGPSDAVSGGQEGEWDVTAPVDWQRLSVWVEDSELPASDVVDAVLDTHGWDGLTRLIQCLKHPGDTCLAIAEKLASGAELDTRVGSPRLWAVAAAAHGTSPGSTRRLLALGVDPTDLSAGEVVADREHLLELTRAVQESSVRWEDGRLAAWLDASARAAHRDPLGLSAADALIVGEGWYRCWLRFALALSRAEATISMDRSSLALEGLQFLTADLRPFAGDPRSCDLYSLHTVIAETIEHAMGMLDDEQWPAGLRVLVEVSDAITTTLHGELGGPVPADLVLRLAVQGAIGARRDVAERVIADEIARGSGRRFYSDLAEYRLLGARLALASDDRGAAEALWHEACVFLTAYGWHKDITIYEVLDPLPVLIEADPAAARLRVAQAQAFCERIPLHTDGRETRGAWSRWWKLLAKADPVAAVELAAPQLLRECNDPNWLLNDALEDVWREWHEHADAVVAGALRLTLDTPLDPADAEQLERLARHAEVSGTVIGPLFTWLLARADERPVSYSYTNSDELIARDDGEVARLNAVAEAAGFPSVSALRDDPTRDDGGSRWGERSARSTALSEPEISQLVGFPSGLSGLAKAIRAWRNRPYDTRAAEWATERFANVIGYRVLELLADGRTEDAASALRSLADSSGFGERSGILRLIGEGLERRGETQLAALAYTLAWTRTRGHGGWLTFGGETEIESLHRATALDAATANAVVAAETERIVASSRYGTYGISQALIYALAVGALAAPEGSGSVVAFAAWDEAAGVIASRAPRVDASDDPEVPYVPPSPDTCERAPGDLEGALALATLGGLAHPGREKKRRAFLAIQLLLAERPAVVAPALALALRMTSDPATLTWLLSVLESAGATAETVVDACQVQLRELVSSDLLTVRALARRMVVHDPPPLVPSAPADGGLVGRSSDVLWTPDDTDDGLGEAPPGLGGLLESAAGRRLRLGERLLDGFEEGVRTRVAATLSGDALKKRIDGQLDVFGDRVNKRWPDAFLAQEESIEVVIQSVAAGGRAALIMAGNPVTDPVRWEDDLASAIVDDPTIPLTLEARRHPRPQVPPPPRDEEEVWAQIQERAEGGSSEQVQDALENGGLLLATLTLEPLSALPIVGRGLYRGWYWLGTLETRAIRRRSGRRDGDLIAWRYRVLEVRDANDRQALTSPPVAAGDLRFWRADVDASVELSALGSSRPLVGVDNDLTMRGDGRQGLGVPDSLLVPTPVLLAVLGLYPGAPWSYDDNAGTGLALVTWRAEYDVSDYYLAWPRTCGCGIVIRPDLLGKLGAAAGEDRLILRDYVAGHGELTVGGSKPPVVSTDDPSDAR